jgi:hypothetical protein
MMSVDQTIVSIACFLAGILFGRAWRNDIWQERIRKARGEGYRDGQECERATRGR